MEASLDELQKKLLDKTRLVGRLEMYKEVMELVIDYKGILPQGFKDRLVGMQPRG